MPRTRSRSRSPILRNPSSNTPQFLQIRNFPRHWDFDKIKSFLKSKSNDSLVSSALRYVDMLKDQGSCIVRFNSSAAALKCLRDCDGIILEDKKLDVQLCDISNTPSCQNPIQNVDDNNYSNNNNSQQQNNQQHSVDSFESYGLSLNYLTSLRIKPPLVNRIFVNNLDPRVDEEKLHEVFSMAGTITYLVLIRKQENTENEKISAKIVYDHPVEAVQAVAMFHNQLLYDRRILTRLDFISKGPFSKLPDHLQNVGMGLGNDGEPLKNVRLHLEIIALKQELNSKLDMLFQQNQSMRQMAYNSNAASTSNQMLSNMNMGNMNSLNNPNNQPAVNSMFQNAITPNNMQIWAGLMQNPLALAMQARSKAFNSMNEWNFGNKMITNPAYVQENMDGSNMVNHQSVPNQGNQEYNSRRAGDDRDKVFIDDKMDLVDMRSMKEGDDRNAVVSDMVIFTNLPTNVSCQSLKAKMKEVGDVRFVELTGDGRALVRFNSARDCERCQKMFHLSRVDGQTIQVNYC